MVLPAYTCQVVENAILASGCLPLYCDINEKDWSISFSEFNKLINKLKDPEKGNCCIYYAAYLWNNSS